MGDLGGHLKVIILMINIYVSESIIKNDPRSIILSFESMCTVISAFSKNSLEKLSSYKWPGNVRELENFVERAVVLSNEKIIDDDSNIFDVLGQYNGEDSLTVAVEKYEKGLIRRALERAEMNQTKAADFLKIDRSTLISKLKKLKIN